MTSFTPKLRIAGTSIGKKSAANLKGDLIMSMSNNKKTEIEGQKVYASGVNKDTHFNTPQGPKPYPKVNYDKMWNVEGYYNDNDGNDIRDRD